ncbi:MAG: branched-chain amino acid ABC transporter permease [Desulfobacterales bacterium]|nr:branched-chain amino acid ABC transporter permease [Desulfobacterales bacterium]
MRKHALTAAALAGAVILPVVLNEAFYQHILITSGINVILAVSLGIIMGYLGELSLGHGAFYGIGAYTSALLAMKLGVPFPAAFVMAVLFSGVMGYLIGIPALRLSGHYFAIATLGFQGIVILLIINLVELTRGPMGLPGIPGPGELSLGTFTISFQDKIPYFYMTLLVVVVVLYLTRNLLQFRYGRAFIATREDPMLAASIGVEPRKYRMLAFTISTAIAGAAGSLYAHYALFISPDSFHLPESIYIATMVIVGGRGTIAGPVIGALVLTTAPEVLRSTGNFQFVLYGLILMVVVVFFPKGIVGLFTKKAKNGSENTELPTAAVNHGTSES